MNRLLLLLVFFSLTFCSLSPAQAQWFIGGNIKVYDPVGDFDDRMNTYPAGLSFSGMKQGQGRWTFGGEIGVAMYTNDKYQYDLTSEGYPGRTLEVDEEDCFWTVHALARYSVWSTPSISHYLEFRAGVTTFFSTITALEEHNTSFDDKFEVHGTAFNTAFGTGISINPGAVLSKGEAPGSFRIDMGFNVHSGSNAAYRNFKTTEDQPRLANGNHKSLTNYIDYKVGFMFELY